MSDDMNMSGEEPIVPEGTVAPLPAPPLIKPGLARRNILLIVASVIVLIVLVAFVGIGFFLAQKTTTSTTPGNGGITVVPSGPTTGSTGATGSATPSAPLPAVPLVDNSDAFSPRNPFSPIPPIAILSTTTVDDSTNTSSTASTDDHSNTLTLQDIITENSVLKAVVRLNGHTYTVAAGQQVGTSSWSVTEVHDDYIVALFGDVSVTLHLGQGSSK